MCHQGTRTRNSVDPECPSLHQSSKGSLRVSGSECSLNCHNKGFPLINVFHFPTRGDTNKEDNSLLPFSCIEHFSAVEFWGHWVITVTTFIANGSIVLTDFHRLTEKVFDAVHNILCNFSLNYTSTVALYRCYFSREKHCCLLYKFQNSRWTFTWCNNV